MRVCATGIVFLASNGHSLPLNWSFFQNDGNFSKTSVCEDIKRTRLPYDVKKGTKTRKLNTNAFSPSLPLNRVLFMLFLNLLSFYSRWPPLEKNEQKGGESFHDYFNAFVFQLTGKVSSVGSSIYFHMDFLMLPGSSSLSRALIL